MAHDATKAMLGTVKETGAVITSHKATIAAGIACRQKSDGTITTAVADGGWLGVSKGRDMSDSDKTSIVRSGRGVPIRLTEDLEPVIGSAVWIDDVTGYAQAEYDDGVIASTVSNAIYISGELAALDENGDAAFHEDGTTPLEVAYIDMKGGL